MVEIVKGNRGLQPDELLIPAIKRTLQIENLNNSFLNENLNNQKLKISCDDLYVDNKYIKLAYSKCLKHFFNILERIKEAHEPTKNRYPEAIAKGYQAVISITGFFTKCINYELLDKWVKEHSNYNSYKELNEDRKQLIGPQKKIADDIIFDACKQFMEPILNTLKENKIIEWEYNIKSNGREGNQVLIKANYNCRTKTNPTTSYQECDFIWLPFFMLRDPKVSDMQILSYILTMNGIKEGRFEKQGKKYIIDLKRYLNYHKEGFNLFKEIYYNKTIDKTPRTDQYFIDLITRQFVVLFDNENLTQKGVLVTDIQKEEPNELLKDDIKNKLVQKLEEEICRKADESDDWERIYNHLFYYDKRLLYYYSKFLKNKNNGGMDFVIFAKSEETRCFLTDKAYEIIGLIRTLLKTYFDYHYDTNLVICKL